MWEETHVPETNTRERLSDDLPRMALCADRLPGPRTCGQVAQGRSMSVKAVRNKQQQAFPQTELFFTSIQSKVK